MASWFDATPEEQREILGAIPRVRQQIECELRPDRYNIGVNVGEAAGQTVHPLHVHVIPRYSGDVPDPRGGVRHVIPSRGNYLAPLLPLPDSRTRSALVAGWGLHPLRRGGRGRRIRPLAMLGGRAPHHGLVEDGGGGAGGASGGVEGEGGSTLSQTGMDLAQAFPDLRTQGRSEFPLRPARKRAGTSGLIIRARESLAG